MYYMSQIPANYKTTAEIHVPEKTINQVLGQEKSVELIKKAAAQKRNVLLVGIPGTGKSMLAQGMAEILPVQKLHDVLMYPNAADPNNPKVKVVKAGEGQKILQKERLESKKEEDNMRLFSLILPIGWFILASVVWQMGWVPDVVFAAMIILGGFLVVGTMLGSQLRTKVGNESPKLLIDNDKKKIAPFFEGTGARAGSLLGDVRHDPLQCNYGFSKLYLRKGAQFEEITFIELWSHINSKYKHLIERNEKNYEAVMLPPGEELYTIGYKEGKPVVSRILSLNRQPFEGKLVDIKVGEKTVSLTPEHKVFTSKESKEAENISERDNLILLEEIKVIASAIANFR
ncbi:MAG: ATP-binding protein [Candidatus Diapherotrites archaeon]